MAKTVLEQQVRKAGEQEFMSSNDIVGKRVENPEGYDLGEISNLRVGLPSGRVVYAVLRTGGMLGLGAKFFAIPIEAMVYRPGDEVFVVNISKYKVDNDPGFAEDEWPREANWDLIESTRPMGPPSQEEARAVARTEPPPREVVTTERVEVRDRPASEEMPIKAERVEGKEIPVTAESERPAPTPEPPQTHLSAADLQVYLKDIRYPAGREDLINHAREHNASADVIAALERFSKRNYQSAADVSEEFGRIG